MSNSSSLRSSRAASRASSVDVRRMSEDVPNQLEAVRQRLEEEAVDDVDEQPNAKVEEEEEDHLPVPQVKVDADGNIIIDEASTMIETNISI